MKKSLSIFILSLIITFALSSGTIWGEEDHDHGKDEAPQADSVWGAMKYSGHYIKKGSKTAGHEIKDGSIKAGKGIKKGGKATGRAFEKAGGSIKKFFVGDD